MNLKYAILIILYVLLLATAGAAMGVQTQEKGAAELELNGGNRGPVPFPHLRHQETMGECGTCHDIFPQKKGGIDELKARGELKSKQVMNKQCIRCHREMKKAGEKAGPTTCSSCHVRPEN